MKEVFISYESSNQKQAESLVAALEEKHYDCWIAARDVPKGEPYDDYIPKAIAQCRIVVMLFSEASLNSPHVKKELRIAVKHDRKVIPFMLEEVVLREAFEYHIESNNRISADTDWDKAVEELLISLKDVVSSPTLEPETKATEISLVDKLNEMGVACPLCRSRKYSHRFDHLEQLLFTDEGIEAAYLLGKKSTILCILASTVLLLYFFLYSLLHDLKLFPYEETKAYLIFFVIILPLSFGLAFFFKKCDWIYEQRRRTRVRKHIAVYHLTCNSCMHKFKTVINLDTQTVIKHTQIKWRGLTSALVDRISIYQVILLISAVIIGILLVSGRMSITINELYNQITSIIN